MAEMRHVENRTHIWNRYVWYRTKTKSKSDYLRITFGFSLFYLENPGAFLPPAAIAGRFSVAEG